MSFDIVRATPASNVVTSGTITFSYPTNRDSGAYRVAGHKAFIKGHQSLIESPTGFTLTFGTSSITFTYLGSTAIPAGTEVSLHLDRKGADSGAITVPREANPRIQKGFVAQLQLGAPDVADADGISASQSVGLGGSFLINGALASSGIATFDVPRNVVGAWTTASVVTVTGTDEYGDVVVEASASGTTFTGKKAFKTITGITSSAAITLATMGSGDVLGLPVVISEVANVFRELQDGAAAAAGTVVKADLATPTATTGDVRGTYDPNAAADGARAFTLFAVVDDYLNLGADNYDG